MPRFLALTLLASAGLGWGRQVGIPGPAIAKPSQPFDPAGIHVVEFTDDSVLHGTVASISADALLLQRSDASGVMAFPLASLASVVFDSEMEQDGPVPRSTVQLVTGDWFVAEVLLVRDGKVELRLANQQRLTLEQKWIEWICFAKGAAPEVFHGPESLEGWNTNGSWTCEDGVLRCQQLGNIGRTFPVVPDRIDLQFDMEKSEVQKNFMMSFNFARQADSLQGSSGNAWTQVRLNEGQLYIYAASGNTNKNTSLSLPRQVTKPNEKGMFRYRILFDRIVGRMVLMINGKIVADQEIPPVDPGTWNGTMTFQPMRWGAEAEWALSNIHMLPWDGQVPASDGASTPARLDTLTMDDGTVKLGRAEALMGTVVRFRSAQGIADIDRNTVSMLRLHRMDPDVELPVAKGPRLTLADRGEIKLDALQLADGTYTLATSFAGELKFPARSVYALSFPNPEKKELPVTDRLVFRNGDQLRGTLKEAGHDTPIQWQFTDGPELAFQTKRVGGVLLSPRPNSPVPGGDCVVRFRNGDWLGGQFVELGSEQLRLLSGFGNEMLIARPKVQTLYLSSPGKAAIWEGGTQPESWWKGYSSQSGNWVDDGGGESRALGPRKKVYLDGAFLVPGNSGRGGGLGKQLDGLPERVEITFEVAGANVSPAFNMQLFYEKQGNSGLMLQVWQGGIYVYDMTPRDRKGGNFMGGQPQQVQWGDKVDSSARRHRFRILADRRAHKATVYIDDVQIATVNRKASKEGGAEALWGTGVSFSSNSGNAAVIFNRLWVAPWNGQMPSTAKSGAPQESVALANGDEAKAAIKKGSKTGFTLDFDGEELEIPREKILLADFGISPPEEALKLSLTDGAIAPRLRLIQGGALTVETLHINNGQVVCSSPSFGDIKVPLGNFSEIVWSGLDRDIQNLQSKPRSPTRKAPKQ
jgi:ribosomal protein L30/L7E